MAGNEEIINKEIALLKALSALHKRLLEYNRDTFGQYMQDLDKTHEKQIEANRQMRLEIRNLKLRVQEVESYLAYLRSMSNPISLQFQWFPFQKNMAPTNFWPVSMWKLASHRSRNLENTWTSGKDMDILEYLDFLFFPRILQPVILICKFMTADTGTIPVSQLQFNDHYKGQLDQLPPSIKKEVWLCLTTWKNNPLSVEQASGIHPDIDSLLTKEIDRYYKKKDRQKLKIEANTASDGSSTLTRLDFFEKQLEEREALLRQKENSIKKAIEAQVALERKHLKDEYDDLELQLRTRYELIFKDLENKSFTLSNQLESQYKTRHSSLDIIQHKKDKEIAKISSAFTKAKDEIKELKKFYEYEYRILADVIKAKDLKIIELDNKLHNVLTRYLFDETIELAFYKSHGSSEEWLSRRDHAKKHPEIRKKYSFWSRQT